MTSCVLFRPVLALITRWLAIEAVKSAEYYTYPMPPAGGNKAAVEMRIVGFDVDLGNDMTQHVNGHVAMLSNPQKHFSVVPPLPGGCGTFSRVSDVANLHSPKCRFATNAGLFNVHTKACYGNIVSNGKILQTVPLNETNVVFGVKNGRYIVGYVSPEDIKGGGFEELVAGLGWLVKNGTNVVKETWKDANIDVQTSGKGFKYARMRSGRTAVGHDSEGRLVIFQVDGDARGVHSYGMTLEEVADRLISHFNVTNAIGLDSGGSTSFARDGNMVNYPSDQQPPSCPELPPYECERPTSTALCVHDSVEEQPKVTLSFWSFGAVMAAVGLLGSAVGGVAAMTMKKSRKERDGNRDLKAELTDDKEDSDNSSRQA